jgi:hypothetical protein
MTCGDGITSPFRRTGVWAALQLSFRVYEGGCLPQSEGQVHTFQSLVPSDPQGVSRFYVDHQRGA